jgi:sulfur dioxygenase
VVAPEAPGKRIAGNTVDGIQIVDVREPAEFADALGRVRGARPLPLSQLVAHTEAIARARPHKSRLAAATS